MKNNIKIAGIALILITGIAGCEKNYVEPVRPVSEIVEQKGTEAANDLMKGSWRITSFEWGLREQNKHFENYEFRFFDNGVVVATHDGIKERGKWNRRNTIFQLIFDSKPLTELNDSSWNYYTIGRSMFVLKGLSPRDHRSQIVEFER